MGSKLRLTIGITAAAVISLAGCSSSSSDSGGTSGSLPSVEAPAGLVQSGAFTVCVDVEFPPMEFFANGSSGDPIGFDISEAKLVAKQWGVSARFVNTAFDGLIPGLQTGKCDAVWSALYINDERQKVADAVPYFKTGNGVLVAAGNPKNIKQLSDLAGKRVAVAGGTDTETQLQQQNKDFAAAGKPQMQISVYPKFTEEVGAIASGKADAMVEVDVSVGYVAKTSPSKFTSVTGVFPVSNQLGVYVNKGSALAPALTAALAAISKSGDADKAAEEFGLSAANVIP